jgi:hypothetical protein
MASIEGSTLLSYSAEYCMNKKLIIIFISLLLLTSGCGIFRGRHAQAATLIPLDSLELSLARVSLTDADFEHYKISHGKLFWECGFMRRNRYNPKEQELASLSIANEKSIREQLAPLVEHIKETDSVWEPPGKLSDLADPGELKVSIFLPKENFTALTSLDSIVNPSSSKERALQKLVLAVRRSLSKPPCGNKTFFGFRSMLE